MHQQSHQHTMMSTAAPVTTSHRSMLSSTPALPQQSVSPHHTSIILSCCVTSHRMHVSCARRMHHSCHITLLASAHTSMLLWCCINMHSNRHIHVIPSSHAGKSSGTTVHRTVSCVPIAHIHAMSSHCVIMSSVYKRHVHTWDNRHSHLSPPSAHGMLYVCDMLISCNHGGRQHAP